MSEGFSCRTCGQWHPELPLCFGPDAPDLVYTIPEEERAQRVELTSDQCAVDEKYFFIRGRLCLPIIDGPESFVWLAWVSLSEASFLRTCELWDTEGRETEPACFGWLQNDLPYASPTLNLKTQVVTQPVGERPLIEIFDSDHELEQQQRHGVKLQEVQRMVEGLLHEPH